MNLSTLYRENPEAYKKLMAMQATIRTALPTTLEHYTDDKKFEDFQKEQVGLLKAMQRMKPEVFQNLQDLNADKKSRLLDFAQFYSDDRDILPYRREALQNQVYRGMEVPWGLEDAQKFSVGGATTSIGGLMSPVNNIAYLPGNAHEYETLHESTHGEDFARGLLYPSWDGSGNTVPIEEIEAANKLHNDIYQADLEYLQRNESKAEDSNIWDILLFGTANKIKGIKNYKGSTKRFK